MWDQYKKTFLGMQVVILLVTAGMYLVLSRDVAQVATFFATLQVAGLLGAYWGDRLRKRVRGTLG
jgi:multisubunit Na+/H+ antiporter MnhC subunit